MPCVHFCLCLRAAYASEDWQVEKYLRSYGRCVGYCVWSILPVLGHALGVLPCQVPSLSPQGGNALPKGAKLTFPQAPDSFFPGDGSVGIHRPSVFPLASSSQAYHGLKSDLHHICGLGTGHCHGSRGATRQNPDSNAGVWGGQREIGVPDAVRISPCLSPASPSPTLLGRPHHVLDPHSSCQLGFLPTLGWYGCPLLSMGAGTHGPLPWVCRTA